MNTSFFGILIASFIAFIFPKQDHTFDHMQQIFLHKKTNWNPRSFDLDKESYIKGVAITSEDLSHLKEILSKCQRKKIVLYVSGSESIQYFGLINNKDQTKEYLWMTFDLLYYSKTNRYYIIRNKKDKEWMKNFFEKYTPSLRVNNAKDSVMRLKKR